MGQTKSYLWNLLIILSHLKFFGVIKLVPRVQSTPLLVMFKCTSDLKKNIHLYMIELLCYTAFKFYN